MKIQKKVPAEVVVPSSHKSFIQYSLETGRVSYSKMNKPMKLNISKEGIIMFQYRNQQLLNTRLKLYPEALAYMFHLEGCPRKLLMFILLYKVDARTGEFKCNPLMWEHFKEYCQLFKSSFKDDVLKQGLRKLVDMNIVCNVKRGTYMLNPFVYGGNNEAGRRELIHTYCRLLQRKGKDLQQDFYPIYDISKK